ncbi:glycerophosphodiester phosphodiesterase family protein [Staphylococcus cohnii]|uniref:glycerophosphodiester phosphodiesterase family protein n=1 Tax=Staphylococcus cohnii TaxID=29382 RepID=UPI001868EAC5|nr:glycerophosphodiester phosphodiesterase family protein [Staphylococcus cohnii]
MKRVIGVGILSGILLSGCSPDMLSKKYLNIAHRGASGSTPEHTFVAYDKAIELDADYIEVDLQMTKDNKLIAMHDSKVDRTTDNTGYVKYKNISQIKKLDAGSWFDKKYKNEKVPELAEILKKYYKKSNFYIETKNPEMYPGMDEKLVEELNKKVLLGKNKLKKGKVIIQSFSESSLVNIHKINKNIPLIKLIDDNEINSLSDKELQRLSKFIYGIGMNHKSVNPELVKRVHDNGLKVHVFTLNSKGEVKKMKKMGVDGGFNNNP